jgi:ABC-type nitrate/sulfonate/bicarbonate transport system substrate-binding protein
VARLAEHPEVVIATSMVMRRETVESQRDTVLNLLRGYLEGVAVFYKNPAAARSCAVRWPPTDALSHACRS